MGWCTTLPLRIDGLKLPNIVMQCVVDHEAAPIEYVQVIAALFVQVTAGEYSNHWQPRAAEADAARFQSTLGRAGADADSHGLLRQSLNT